MRVVFKIVLVLTLVYLVLVAGLAISMRQPPEKFGAVMAKLPPMAFMVLPFRLVWMNARAGSLTVGEAAPDFSLEYLDHSSTMRLSSLRGQRPVVLVFGSYT